MICMSAKPGINDELLRTSQTQQVSIDRPCVSRKRETNGLHLALRSLGTLARVLPILASTMIVISAQAESTISTMQDPIMVRVDCVLDPVILATAPELNEVVVQNMLQTILPVIDENPRQLMTIRMEHTPMRFVDLNDADRAKLTDLYGLDAADRFESAMATLLIEVLNATLTVRGNVAFSFFGMPFETQGDDLVAIQRTNDRFRSVINRLHAFTSEQSFMIMGGSRDEAGLVMDTLTEAMRLNNGQAVIFRTNGKWRVFMTDDYDEDSQIVLDDESEIPDEKQFEVAELESLVARLNDDPFDDFTEVKATTDEITDLKALASTHPDSSSTRQRSSPGIQAPRSNSGGIGGGSGGGRGGGSGGGSGGGNGGGGGNNSQPESGTVDGTGDTTANTFTGTEDQMLINDCNGNGIADADDIASGLSADCNVNGIPDECETLPDSDGDGTPDCDDQCPNDPNKITAGPCGCGVADLDSDGDGMLDCEENCPFDPNKTEPGLCGCGVPDLDSDGDGTLDCYDECPHDPFKTLAGDCGCGVEDLDTDGDGTVNCLDKCPDDSNKIDPGDCGCGVEDLDTDSDGIMDCLDEYPDDPGVSQRNPQQTYILPGSGWSGATPQLGPVGTPDMPGYDAKAIARWDVVPYQTFDGDFEVGVVAFHINGIDRVDFAVDGGEWVSVTEMTLNPRTNMWEYWIALDARAFKLGVIQVRALAWPKTAGQVRVLQGSVLVGNGEYSLFLNADPDGSVLANREVRWVKPSGSNDSGDGSQENPYATIKQAAMSINEAQGGRADNGLIYLEAGEYDYSGGWNGSTWKSPVTEDAWLTIAAAPGVSRAEAKMVSNAVRLNASRIHIRNITVTAGGIKSSMNLNHPATIWFDGAFLTRHSRYEGSVGALQFTGGLFATDVVVEEVQKGFTSGTRLVRNVILSGIGEDTFQNVEMVLNTSVDETNKGNTAWHPDTFQWNGGVMENVIYYNIHATNVRQQNIHVKDTTAHDVAFVNVLFHNASDSYFSQWWTETNHLLLWHITAESRPFWFRGDGAPSLATVSNLSIRNSVFREMTGVGDTPNGIIDQNHFISGTAWGTNATSGDPLWKMPVMPEFQPAAISPLRQRLPELLVPADVRGRKRALPAATGAATDTDQDSPVV